MTSPETLVPALSGIDKLLLISANEIGRRTPQHQAVINAAKVAGVPYLAYTSLLRADTSPARLTQHRETEKLIQDSGITYTFLITGIAKTTLRVLLTPLKLGRFWRSSRWPISSASRIDYAEAAAKVLTSTGHENKTYELAGF